MLLFYSYFLLIVFLFYSYFFSALFPIFLLFEQPPSLDSLPASPGIVASFRSRYDISHNVDSHRTTNHVLDGVRNWVDPCTLISFHIHVHGRRLK